VILVSANEWHSIVVFQEGNCHCIELLVLGLNDSNEIMHD